MKNEHRVKYISIECDIHNVEKEIVKEMAEKTGSTLRIIPTHNLDFYPEAEIESIWKVCFDKNQFGECHEECEKDIAPFTELTS